MADKVRVQVTLNAETVRRLEELCRYHGVSKSVMMTLAIGSEYIKILAARGERGSSTVMEL